ncbi:MAG: response regulator [Gemmatimonadaceae bacterium]|nr:response regulator [Gemmatimonadaceae bacterium]
MAINVLVVDDSAVMRSMLIRTLRLSGLPLTSVYQAGNGAEALATLAAHEVDLALVDINMPVMNGEQLIDQVRADARLAGVAIVVVSTEGSETRIAALKARGASFIHKPFTPEQVRTTVLRVLGVADA